MVLAPNRLFLIYHHVRFLSMSQSPKVSVLIPTLDRGEELERCLKSLHEQTFKNFEIIIESERGPLARIRNQAARRAKGEIIVFIDDDVECTSDWLNAIVTSFGEVQSVVGVSGPSTIPQGYKGNRDLFRYSSLKWLYDFFFLERKRALPGHFSKSGAFTTGASEEDCSYDGEVQFLEACNMAYKREVFEKLGGFDEAYTGVGEWSEPDLCFRIKNSTGGKFYFSPRVRVSHLVSKAGAFKLRKAESAQRMANYWLFSSRWIKPCLSHSAYKLFVRLYYAFKSL